MRFFLKWRRTAVCLVALCLLSSTFLRPSKAQVGRYTIIDLATLGGLQSKAYSINSAGRVAGDSTPSAGSSSPSPFAWQDLTFTNIGTFGGDSGTAFSVNALGNAVGNAATSTNEKHVLIWSDIFGKLDIGTLPGGAFATAYDINDANQVVGQSEIAPLVDRGFLWQKSTGMQQIGTLGGSSSAATSINNAGQIVGWAMTSAGQAHAFLLSDGTMTDLGTFGGTTSVAEHINENGNVVGYATLPSNTASQSYHAFMFTAEGGIQDLGTLGGGNRSIAYDANNVGQVVGGSEITPGIEHAFIYDATRGMLDLNDAVTGKGWTLQEARGINDDGVIVGFGINPQGQTHAFELKPAGNRIPPPPPPPCSSGGTAPQPISIPTPQPVPQLIRKGAVRKPVLLSPTP